MSANKDDGAIIVLSSPSGAGKTTLVKKIAQHNNFTVSISHTTRSPRTNEIDGKDYFFISKVKFDNLIKNNEFLEHAEVFKNFYGSTKKFVIENLNQGKNVIFDIDWQGTEQIKEKKLKYKLITVFILPPSKKELFERLSNRDMKDKLIVEQRMKQFDHDILKWKNYDFVVINDNLQVCYEKILYLIECSINNKKLNYDKKQIENHINNLI
tara:strand:+ start:260 stop:892 length:633 start_codon:yes stop_codon:yes gene_type:complete